MIGILASNMKFLHNGSLRSFSLLVPTSIMTGSTYQKRKGNREKVETFILREIRPKGTI